MERRSIRRPTAPISRRIVAVLMARWHGKDDRVRLVDVSKGAAFEIDLSRFREAEPAFAYVCPTWGATSSSCTGSRSTEGSRSRIDPSSCGWRARGNTAVKALAFVGDARLLVRQRLFASVSSIQGARPSSEASVATSRSCFALPPETETVTESAFCARWFT